MDEIDDVLCRGARAGLIKVGEMTGLPEDFASNSKVETIWSRVIRDYACLFEEQRVLE